MIYKCSLDLGVIELEIESVNQETAVEYFIDQVQEIVKDQSVDVRISDDQYTDQQELADRERDI